MREVENVRKGARWAKHRHREQARRTATSPAATTQTEDTWKKGSEDVGRYVERQREAGG